MFYYSVVINRTLKVVEENLLLSSLSSTFIKDDPHLYN